MVVIAALIGDAPSMINKHFQNKYELSFSKQININYQMLHYLASTQPESDRRGVGLTMLDRV